MKIDWRRIVGTVAPTLATALGGPLAGVAVKTIASQLLGRPEASESEVEEAILGADPQTLLRLREIDVEFERAMAQAGIELERISADDRANAREREIKSGDSWTPRVIAAAVVLGYFAVQWWILSHIVPAEQREIIMRSLGVLDTALGLVLGYYFGSSSGNARMRDALLARR